MRRDRPNEPTRLVRLSLLTPLALLAAAAFTLPIVWTLGSALRPSAEIFRYLSPLTLRAIVPATLSGENFAALLAGPFPRAVLNLLIVAGVTVAAGLLVCAMAAFGLSVPRFRLRDALFAVVVVSFLVPFDAIAIPLSELFRTWGLANSYAGLILPGIGNGLAIFLLRQFFLGIPNDYQEAATLEGANPFQIYWQIFLPLARPALAAFAFLVLQWSWNEFLWALIVTNSTEKQVLSVGIALFQGQYSTNTAVMLAAANLATLPVLILFVFFQKQLIEGIALSGLK